MEMHWLGQEAFLFPDLAHYSDFYLILDFIFYFDFKEHYQLVQKSMPCSFIHSIVRFAFNPSCNYGIMTLE